MRPLADFEYGDVFDAALGRRRTTIHPAFPSSSPRLLLLVHGFNVKRTSAERDYDVFRARLREVAPGLLRDTKTLNWPGDKLFWNAVIAAKGDVAAGLSRFLEQGASANTEIILVGHSLGCRLILEALAQLLQRGRAALVARIKVYLMAAAVPVAEARTRLSQAIFDCATVECFHSRSDTILRFTFPLGEFPTRGTFEEAVGLNGNPLSMWRREQRMIGFTHGDYWDSLAVAYAIALSLGEATTRPVPQRSVPDRSPPKRVPSLHRGAASMGQSRRLRRR